jgi:hypothetical protein
MDHPALDDFVARAHKQDRRDELDEGAVAALDAIGSAGAEALLLKGPALAQRLYAKGETRGYTDIDLLVPPRHLTRARQALIALGYGRPEECLGIVDVAGIQHSETWAGRPKPNVALWLDLHWRLSGCEAPGDFAWDQLAEGRGWIELAGRQVPILGDHGLALHLALHVAQDVGRNTKTIGDLVRGIERWPVEVWRDAAQLAESVEATPAFAAGLRVIPKGAELASRLNLARTPEFDWEIRHADERPRGTFHLEAVVSAQGTRNRLGVLRRSLIPTARWIRSQFPWARGRLLLIVAYACHIARAPVWAARAIRFRRARRSSRSDVA